MIEEARKILKKRLFATTKDYNALPGGYDYLEKVAAENRKNLSPLKRQETIERLQKKLDKADGKVIERMRLGRSRGGTAGALNRDVHNLGFSSDQIKHQIKLLQNNE